MTKALEQAIIGYWGERCADFDAGCPCCKAWAELDALEGGVTVTDGKSLTSSDIVRTIAKRMSSLRTARRLSLQEVADSAGLTKSHIWELEQGRTSNPTVATVVALSRAFGVSIDYLTGLSSDVPDIHPDALRIACDIDRLLRKEKANV